MLKKVLQILLMCSVTLGSYQLSLGGDKIKLHLHQPPPNKLGASDLWKLDITNTTNADISIYITGTAIEEKDGLIVEGQSKVFTVKPGKKTYGYNDFKSGNVSWKNKTYEEAIIRTGNVKSGSYTICVTAFYEDGNIADIESCIEQRIETISDQQIILISPGDDEEIDPESVINFMWTGTGLKGPYSLVIKEVKSGQTNEQVMKENRTFYEKKDIKTTSFQYPQSEKKLEKGEKYAWIVKSGESESDVQVFSLLNEWIEPIEIKVSCLRDTIGGKIYELKFKINNPVGWTVNVTSITNDPNVVLTLPPPTGYTYYVNPMISLITPVTIANNMNSSDITLNIVDINPVDNPFRLRMYYNYTDGSGNTANESKWFNVELPSCCVTPPPGMIDWWKFDEISGTASSDIAGFDNTGTYVGSPLVITGMVNNALEFNGNNYVEVPNHSEINFGPCDSFSIDTWIKTIPPNTNSSNVYTILDKREKGYCSSLGYALYLYKGRLGMQIGTGPNFTNYNAQSGYLVNDGRWHLVAVTYDRTTLKFYHDNNLVGSFTLSIPNLNNSANLVIGGRHPNFTFTSFYGDIDELEFFRREITQNEITAIFNAGPAGKCRETPPSNDCGVWDQVTVQQGNITGSLPVVNKQVAFNSLYFSPNLPINVTPVFSCIPASLNATYQWRAWTASGPGPYQNGPISHTFNITGLCGFTIKPLCGSIECDTVHVFIITQ